MSSSSESISDISDESRELMDDLQIKAVSEMHVYMYTSKHTYSYVLCPGYFNKSMSKPEMLLVKIFAVLILSLNLT